jgi:excisionase family DNA binding protein
VRANSQKDSVNRAFGDECAPLEVAMKAWLTVVEAAHYAGVSRDTIYTACERREIRHARLGGRRAIRMKPGWIDAWLERHVWAAQDRHPSRRADSVLDVQTERTS